MKLQKIGEKLNPCTMMAERIGREINNDAPVAVAKGNVIAAGVNEELDELYEDAKNYHMDDSILTVL